MVSVRQLFIYLFMLLTNEKKWILCDKLFKEGYFHVNGRRKWVQTCTNVDGSDWWRVRCARSSYGNVHWLNDQRRCSGARNESAWGKMRWALTSDQIVWLILPWGWLPWRWDRECSWDAKTPSQLSTTVDPATACALDYASTNVLLVRAANVVLTALVLDYMLLHLTQDQRLRESGYRPDAHALHTQTNALQTVTPSHTYMQVFVLGLFCFNVRTVWKPNWVVNSICEWVCCDKVILFIHALDGLNGTETKRTPMRNRQWTHTIPTSTVKWWFCNF